MPKVLVLLASFNGDKWLSTQCSTILGQTGVEISLVVSDDLSTDRSFEYLLSLQSSDDRVKVLQHALRAGTAGKNFYRLIRDVDADGFDYVSFADQDDIWHPNKLERACAELSRSGAAGYSSAVTATYVNSKANDLRQSPKITPVDFVFEGAGQGCTFVIRPDLFSRVQSVVRDYWPNVREVHHHDWLIYALCRSWELRWYFDPVSSMDYRQHGSNELGGRASLAGVSKRWAMIESGWYEAQIEAVCKLIVDIGCSASIAHVLKIRRSPRGFSARLAWIALLFTIGRRKAIDRLFLGAAAVLGHV